MATIKGNEFFVYKSGCKSGTGKIPINNAESVSDNVFLFVTAQVT
jgi:hypothetical protein